MVFTNATPVMSPTVGMIFAIPCLLFGLWVLSFGGMFGLAQGSSFSDRVVLYTTRESLCTPVPGSGRPIGGGVYRLSSTEYIVLGGESGSTVYYLATPSHRSDGSKCTNLRKVGEDTPEQISSHDISDRWETIWNAALGRTYAAHGNSAGFRHREWGRLVFAEFCRSKEGRLRSPDWCRDGL